VNCVAPSDHTTRDHLLAATSTEHARPKKDATAAAERRSDQEQPLFSFRPRLRFPSLRGRFSTTIFSRTFWVFVLSWRVFCQCRSLSSRLHPLSLFFCFAHLPAASHSHVKIVRKSEILPWPPHSPFLSSSPSHLTPSQPNTGTSLFPSPTRILHHQGCISHHSPWHT
jgi:hypothetical protein